MIFSRLLIALLTFICSASGAFAEPVRVTATIFPIADIVKHIGGDLVDVRILLKPGQDPHSYEASPGTVRAIGKTDILVTAGFGFERFLDKLLKSSSRKGRVVVDLSKAVGHPIKTGKSRSGKHSSVNPHYWLDPLIMSDVALLIGKALEAKIPLSASVINDRTLKTISKLKELDNEISNILNEPGLGNKYVAFHNAWSYFARRYGLKEIGVIKNAPGKEPSAKHIVSLIEKIKISGVKSVIVETLSSPRLGEILASETGVRVVAADPIGGVPGRYTYFELMRWNAKQFAKALSK